MNNESTFYFRLTGTTLMLISGLFRISTVLLFGLGSKADYDAGDICMALALVAVALMVTGYGGRWVWERTWRGREEKEKR